MKNLIDILDLSLNEIFELIETAIKIKNDPSKYFEKCKNKKMATLFFEPSTRTRLSFEAAMYELGGNVIGFSEAQNSSVSKGESVADTAKVVSCYSDIIVMRHPKEGAPLVASMNASVPIINAGDGGHNHPTQTLTDLLTIYTEKKRLDNFTIGFCGDLKFGRTVHSLISTLCRHKNIKMILISPENLTLPRYVITNYINKNNIEYLEKNSLDDVIPELDILYMTRVQKERFTKYEDFKSLSNAYVLTLEKLKYAKEDLCIMHPLPRVDEIEIAVDNDPRSCYFKQVLNGKYIRMALILKFLGIE